MQVFSGQHLPETKAEDLFQVINESYNMVEMSENIAEMRLLFLHGWHHLTTATLVSKTSVSLVTASCPQGTS